MTPLEEHIRGVIRDQGPISIAHYMEVCLTHPEYGYYTSRDPLGRKGDFITAPEVSQMFGELVGLFMADYWLGLGQPKPAHLIELWPGRWTLMGDALRALKVVPGMVEKVHVNFIEVSPALIKKQKKAVPNAAWFDNLEDVPKGFSLIIANEFFDCLPIRQFVMTETGWAERVVGLQAGALGFTLSEKTLPSNLPSRAKPGDIHERCPQAGYWVDLIAGRLERAGGLALIIDYGYSRPAFGDTFQAVKGHDYSDTLATPGEADLTAHVDFTALKEKAENIGLAVYGPKNQGEFLEMVGIEHRAGQLLKGANKDQEKKILGAVKRLVEPSEMGALFKVLALTKKGDPAPAGMS